MIPETVACKFSGMQLQGLLSSKKPSKLQIQSEGVSRRGRAAEVVAIVSEIPRVRRQ